jgi:hypothetical protein
MRQMLAAPYMSTEDATTRPTREKFSCSGDQFDIIVAFAVSMIYFTRRFTLSYPNTSAPGFINWGSARESQLSLQC